MSSDTPSLYVQHCSSSLGSNATFQELLQCIAEVVEKHEEESTEDLRTWLLILTAAMVFLMQAGFAMLCAGSVRIKNVQNTMLKNLLDACGAAISFYSVGFAFAFGEPSNDRDKTTTFIGTSNFFLTGDNVNYAEFLFQFAFAASSTTIVAGTLAERCQMAAYLCYAMMLTAFVYPVIVHALWSKFGFLSPSNPNPLLGIGCIDFAGGLAVHTTGGSAALWAALVLGPRRGRFYDSHGVPLAKPKPFPGHSVALQMLGTFILWFGWFGFNPGSALSLDIPFSGAVAARAAVTTTLGAASASVTALLTKLYLDERRTGEINFNLLACMNGALAGAVCITPGSGVLEPWAAVVMGILAGWTYLGGSELLIKLRIDDAVDAIPVHMGSGILGILGVGFLASPGALQAAYGASDHAGLFYELGHGKADANLLVCQIIGVLFVLGWVFFLMFPFFIWLNYMGWFRSDSLEELVGLDISYHGGSAINTEQVKSEYLDAYNRNKGTIRRRTGRGGGNNEDNRHPADFSINESYEDERGVGDEGEEEEGRGRDMGDEHSHEG